MAAFSKNGAIVLNRIALVVAFLLVVLVAVLVGPHAAPEHATAWWTFH